MRRRDFLRGGGGPTSMSNPKGTTRLGTRTPSSVGDTSAAQRRRRFPDLALVTHEGKRVRLYSDLLRNKTVVLHFMYTTCRASCPRTTANLARVRDLLRPRVGRDIFLYSVTVDPEYDTPARLRRYAEQFGIGPGWVFLTGRPDNIDVMRRCFGDDPASATGESNHLNLLAYGVERLQRWGACPALLDPTWVVRYLSWLDPGGERPSGWWPAGHPLAE